MNQLLEEVEDQKMYKAPLPLVPSSLLLETEMTEPHPGVAAFRFNLLASSASHSSPIARRAEQTVLFSVHKSTPSNKVKAFLEKSTEKRRRLDKMLCDSESKSRA